ncbi:MAG TPA: Gfo/Idh/MocA family oxidoreductase [Capsulimonadaceae bacterium]|jgi:predicted dehydrogenase
MKQIKVGVVGAGQFAPSFIPLFKAHPGVRDVALAEIFPQRLQEEADRFGIVDRYASFDDLLASDVDAVAIYTQRWTHAPMAIKALEAGKHVYSAVPAAVTVEEMSTLIDAVKRTGLTYMMGETSYYYPCAIYCRGRYAAGDMGHFVYGEAEYMHDMSHGFYQAYQHSGGDQWKRHAGFPPMLYPTHSVSMIVSITGQHMVDVSCLGYTDREDDGVFREDVNLWHNVFSNETALFRTSGGGSARINEFRRVGHCGRRSTRCSIYGTLANYEEQADGSIWVDHIHDPVDLDGIIRTPTGLHAGESASRDSLHQVLKDDFDSGFAKVHPRERLPKEFAGLPNGHEGSHQFLVDDFVTAIQTGNRPPVDVYAAARYTVPGIIAHESALRDGERLKVPDFGDGN